MRDGSTCADASGLHYVRQGDGVPLLLIQGTAATHLHWGARLMSLLMGSFDVMAYDHRGVGCSRSATASFALPDLADDAVRLLDEVGWNRVAVFGVSLGGAVAQELALRHPDRVANLILGCTSAGGADRSSTEHFRSLREAVVRGDPEATVRNLFRLGVKEPDATRPQAWLEYRHAALASPVNPRTTAMQIDAFARHFTADRLPGIDVPTHVVHGDADRMTDLADGAFLAQAIPAARFSVLPAGHLFWLELPDATTSLLEDSILTGERAKPIGHC